MMITILLLILLEKEMVILKNYLDRGFFDKLDHLVAVNKPLVKNSYREHIVPLTMVIDEIFRMIKDDKQCSNS